jgi:AAHS family 4-hydroxybenzoate transporter-like MFS transporter
MNTVDVGSVLDEGDWSGYQRLLVFATALTIVFDGLDNQVLGGAVPVMMREWQLPRAALTPALTSGFVGMVMGSFLGGIVGDKLGRRVALLSSLVAFGLLTLLVATAVNPSMLAALRFLCGLGLGGAMPNAASLVSEFSPRRHRPFAVTLTIVCIPLGGTLAGLIGGAILPTYGWRALFVVSGALPLALAAALLGVLPESPRFLARDERRWPQLTALLRRLGHQVAAGATFLDAQEKAAGRGSVADLIAPAYRRDTLALVASFFFCLTSVYIGTNWVPQMLVSNHFDVGTASSGLTAFNLGGVVGAILGAALILRLGSRLSMLGMAAGAIAGAVVLAMMPIGPNAAFAVFALLAWTGGLINAVQTTMYALAAHVYPTSIRSTGVGTAVGIGRIGSVFSPALGQRALDAGGPSSFFALIATTMTIAFAALASVRNHIPSVSPGAHGTAVVPEPARR